MKSKILSAEDMDPDKNRGKSGSKSGKREIDISDPDFLEETDTGTYEVVNGKSYDVHRDIDEEKCIAGTEPTINVCHIIDQKRQNSFWLGLCEYHKNKLKRNEDIEFLPDTRQPVL